MEQCEGGEFEHVVVGTCSESQHNLRPSILGTPLPGSSNLCKIQTNYCNCLNLNQELTYFSMLYNQLNKFFS